MAGELFYEDIAVGMEVPQLIKAPSARQLVMWAAGSGDFYEVHYDIAVAHAAGLRDIIVHGRLKAAFLAQLITDWIGQRGILRKLGVRYREVDFIREQITCKGKVTAKYEKDGQNWVECEIWTENPAGRQTTTGNAVFTLPSRG